MSKAITQTLLNRADKIDTELKEEDPVFLILEHDARLASKGNPIKGVRFLYDGKYRYKKIETTLEDLLKFIPTVCFGAGADYNHYTIVNIR